LGGLPNASILLRGWYASLETNLITFPIAAEDRLQIPRSPALDETIISAPNPLSSSKPLLIIFFAHRRTPRQAYCIRLVTARQIRVHEDRVREVNYRLLARYDDAHRKIDHLSPNASVGMR